MVDSVRFEQLNHFVAFVLLVQQFELLKLERGRRRGRRRRRTEEFLAYVIVAYVVVVVIRDFVRAHRAVALGKILRRRHSRRRHSRRKKRTRIS